MKKTVRTRVHSSVKALLFTLSFLIWPVLAGAQPLDLLASPNPAAVYQKVDLSVIVPSTNPETVSAAFSGSPAAIHVISGPYVQPFVANDASGRSTVKVSYVIEGNEAGRVVVPPLQISAGNESYATKPIVLSFGVPRDGGLVVPLHPVWVLPQERVEGTYYVGEAIPVILELKNELEETKADTVSIPGPMSGLEQTNEFASVSRSTVGTTTLFQVPIASFILTPTEAGMVTLPSTTVKAGKLSGASAPKELQIRPAPGAISESGAIGSFSFRSWATTSSVTDGVEVSLHLRIEGSGNLKHLVLPTPDSGGLLEVGKNETNHLTATASGYTGFKEVVYQYLLQSPSVGDTLTVPSFSWLDLQNGIQSTPAQTISLPAPAGTARAARTQASTTAPGAAATKPAQAKPFGGKLPFNIEPAQVIRRSEYREYYSNGKNYLWLLPGPILFGLFLLTRPRNKGKRTTLAAAAFTFLLVSCAISPVPDSVNQGIEAYAKGNVDQAVKDFAAARESYPQNAPLSFDTGLAEYRLGRYGEAIHWIRTAIYFAPMSERYRSALQWMVDQIGVPEQVPPAYPIHPDLFLLIFIAGINLSAILGILVLMKRSGRLAIALILVLVVSTISAGGLAYTSVRRSAETAVVKSAGTEMTKIPMAVAGRWLQLPAGMAVSVRDSVKGYYLVETAYGNTGWVRTQQVLVDGR